MRIKTQFIVTMALFAIILLFAAASAIVMHQQVDQAGKQERIAASISQGAGDLGYLSNDYLIYRESQQLARWQSRFAAFSEQVAALDVDKPDHQALVANIRANKDRMKAVFDSASTVPPRPPGSQGAALLDPAFLQVSWSRMAVQSQALAADALRLSRLLDQQREWLTDTRTILIYVMVGLFGVFLLTSYRFTYRRILKSMANLQTGTAIIGSGNLDFTVEDGRNDELGELSRAFNRMTSDLKAVTASKADLEREIDERKRVEEALEEINKDLESFSYSVSHDLRAPLRAINGFSQMILKKEGERFDEETRRRFQVIRENAETMGRLIDDLLAFSRLGRQEVTRGNLAMDELIREAWEELVTIHPDRVMTLKMETMPAALGDRTLIRQVYGNLLGNAVKFTQGRETASIETGSYTRDGETVYYCRDNGVGFDMRFHDKLFGVFQRLHSEEEYKGTGIGLALVQRIVHRHGGRIWAEGKVDEGACFCFTLPEKA